MVLSGAVYGKDAYRTESEVAFGRRKTALFLGNVYSNMILVECTSWESSDVFSKGALLKSILDPDFLLVALHHIVPDIFMLECTFEIVDNEMVSVENFQQVTSWCVSHCESDCRKHFSRV